MSTRALRTALLAFSLAAFACGASDEPDPATLGPAKRYPIPGCEAFDPAPCDVVDDECQVRLLGIAACLRGSEPGEPPPISVLTEGEFEDFLRDGAAMEEPNPDRDYFETAFVLLGLAAPGSFGDDASVARAVENIAGLYAWDTQSILIIDHGAGTDREFSSSVLVHEFVHALQDRDVDLKDFSARHSATLDESMAADAMVEGEAFFHEQHYLASMLGFNPAEVDWDALFQNGVDRGEVTVLEAESPVFEGESWFKYRWGGRYIHLGWPGTGHSGVLELFAEPPSTTHEIMAAVDGLVPDDFEPSTLVPPAPPEDWALVGEDRLGAMGTFELLGKLSSSADTGRELALGWRGDALAIFKPANTAVSGTTLVTWSVELTDSVQAGAVGSKLQALPDASVKVDGTRVRVALTDGASDVDWALEPPPEP